MGPLALHIKLEESSEQAAQLVRPAGWPLSVSPPKACRQPPRTQSFEWVPVCVLGPLTTPDKTELQNAVTTYLDEPLEDIW